MKDIRQWIELDPLDTLFFKGSEPMVAGQNHEARTVFPPMPSTLIGAIRTAILLQRGALTEFIQTGKAPSSHSLIGTPDCPGFEITGPLFSAATEDLNHECFFPVPALWFGNMKNRKDGDPVAVQRGEMAEKEIQKLGLKGSVSSPVWVQADKQGEIKPLVGHWANRAAFSAVAQNSKPSIIFKTSLDKINRQTPFLLPLSAFYEIEERTGIALDTETGNRRVRKGHLYSTTHIRLAPGVRLLVGLSETISPKHLDPEGVFPLGGEQRLVRYRPNAQSVTAPLEQGDWAMSLAPFPYSQMEDWGWSELPRVSGPLIRMGGWDMKKGFHKPITTFLPAGSAIRIGKEQKLPFGFIRI